jgi:hypothetical protein
MTHARVHHRAAGILAVAITLVLSASTAIPATARTFSLNSAGSMVQKPLAAEWACVYQRALSDRNGGPCEPRRSPH